MSSNPTISKIRIVQNRAGAPLARVGSQLPHGEDPPVLPVGGGDNHRRTGDTCAGVVDSREVRGMREHPIFFSSPMVRAILAGRKTQTRRVVKPKYETGMWDWDSKDKNYGPFIADEYGDYHKVTDYAPWQPGDRLWVRETFADLHGMGFGNDPVTDKPWNFAYKADIQPGSDSDQARIDYGVKWKPSIHMPRAASRIMLEVTDVRVEQLQDITEEGAIAEGCSGVPCDHPLGRWACEDCYNSGWIEPPQVEFMQLWDSINAKKGYGWNNNPWVWAISFRRIDV